MEMIEALQQDAAKLLTEGRAGLVIGYQARGEHRAPLFAAKADRAQALVYDDACRLNLAAYLRKSEVRRMMPVAIVAGPAVMRNLVILHAESQLAAGNVLVLAVGPHAYYGVQDLAGVVALLKEKYPNQAPSAELLAEVKRVAGMSAEERARFWSEQFARCTRCYACRAACPMCYCTQCIVEKNVPQWISTATAAHGNYAWNVIRAFHLAGRCTLCGACEEACPQGIPLMLLNALLDAEVAEEIGARPGYDPEAQPVIGSWSPDDDNDFMR
jgi:ferredoxin